MNMEKELLGQGIVSRRDASSGLWSSFLLPTAVILSEIKCPSPSHKYMTAACVSSGFLVHSFVVTYRAFGNATNMRKYPIPCLVSTCLLYIFTPEGIFSSIGYGVFSILVYDKIIMPLMKSCPRSFTYGEASIVSQACVLFIVSCLVNIGCFPKSYDCTEISTAVIQVVILGVVGIGVLSYTFGAAGSAKLFYGLVLAVGSLVILPALYFVIGENPIIWVLQLFFEDVTSIQLLGHWLMCSVIGGLAVGWQSNRLQKASTVTRKIFHILIIAVFIPGVIVKPCLIYLASGIVFGLFMLIDLVRLLKISPFGSALQSGFEAFADEKDEGGISLTPLYLLAGCTLPMWLSTNPSSSPHYLLPTLAGLLSVGIGDTAASVCGNLVGKNRWPGLKKTKEGTAACFLSQLFFVIALIHFGYVPRSNLIQPTFAIAVTSVVEAKTTQVDNLVLPLLMYILNI